MIEASSLLHYGVHCLRYPKHARFSLYIPSLLPINPQGLSHFSIRPITYAQSDRNWRRIMQTVGQIL
jgi:hypothetical protein